MGSVTPSSGKSVTLPLCQQKNGKLQPYNKIVFNIHQTHYMYVTMNRCGHLYTNAPYSEHCLHWIQISCHSHSQSHSHISGSVQ